MLVPTFTRDITMIVRIILTMMVSVILFAI